MKKELTRFGAAVLLAAAACTIQPAFADDADLRPIRAKLAEEQKAAADAKTEKDAAQKSYDAASAAHASAPNIDTQRKLDDAEYALKMADYKLSSSAKAVERAQKKLDDALAAAKSAAPAVEVKPEPAKPVVAEKPAVDMAALKTAEEAKKKEQEAAAGAAKQAAEEAAKKAAAEKAAAEAAAKEAAAKKKAAAEAGIDQGKCVALPSAPTSSSTNPPSPTEQAYAQGFVKELNHMLAKKPADDAPPINPFPVLEGTKLSPCEAGQRQALHFAYLGAGQYRLETPVLAGQQTFSVANVATLERVIPESDNGATYVFFLDGREGRSKLSAYKKSLVEPAQ